jgi:hypothetical protein
MQGNRRLQVLKLLAERVCQSSKSAHAHSNWPRSDGWVSLRD